MQEKEPAFILLPKDKRNVKERVLSFAYQKMQPPLGSCIFHMEDVNYPIALLYSFWISPFTVSESRETMDSVTVNSLSMKALT